MENYYEKLQLAEKIRKMNLKNSEYSKAQLKVLYKVYLGLVYYTEDNGVTTYTLKNTPGYEKNKLRDSTLKCLFDKEAIEKKDGKVELTEYGKVNFDRYLAMFLINAGHGDLAKFSISSH